MNNHSLFALAAGSPIACLFALAPSAVGCTATVDSPQTGEATDTTAEAITNGTPVADDGYTGVLALQVFDTAIGGFSTFCSATLMTNTKAITAAHCMEDAVSMGLGQVYARMGGQFIAVTGSVENDAYDIAVIKFGSPMKMWNWSNTGYLTNPRQLTTTGYGRPGFSGTNAQVKQITALGYGTATAANPQPKLASAVLATTYNTDNAQPTGEIHADRNSQGQIEAGGDSGGPGLIGSNIVGAALAYVQSGCFTGTLNFCYGYGAQSWAGWAYLELLAF